MRRRGKRSLHRGTVRAPYRVAQSSWQVIDKTARQVPVVRHSRLFLLRLNRQIVPNSLYTGSSGTGLRIVPICVTPGSDYDDAPYFCNRIQRVTTPYKGKQHYG